jgi:hypothetical protein
MKWKIAALLFFFSASVFADALREKSLDEKVSEATVVLIGTVERLQPRATHAAWADVQVESVLKGTASATIRVRSSTMIIAEEYAPVAVGCRYLFMLYMGKDEMNGP